MRWDLIVFVNQQKKGKKKTRKLHVLTTKSQRAHFSTVGPYSVVMFRITRQILSIYHLRE